MLRTRTIHRPRSRLAALAGVIALASIARADTPDELAAVRRAAAGCDKTRAHCFGLALHVAADARGLVVTPDWVAAQVATANRHFARLDIGFQLAGVDALPASAVHVETRSDRDELASGGLGGKLVHVFVVGQLDDVDVDGAVAWGVTWHQHRDDRKYLIVSAQALERTLAHELGHFFGLPHSSYAISIMNKTERTEPPMDQRTFADEEIDAMRPVLQRLLRDKVIADIEPGS
ncbi:MAG TPA: matrixin family metalloprotease [Kofleriaceae bacterium]|nr:matrixin family metalloprotease [Kofleriaceae bacterium]